MKFETPEQLWQAFCQENHFTSQRCEGAWSFGIDADKLAELVRTDVKTATSSLFCRYLAKNIPLPKVGEYHIVLNGQKKPVCIIQLTNVEVIPFDEVSEQHAFNEGEGNRSLASWQADHRAFFTQELVRYHQVFDEKTPIVCETFKRVYPR